MEKILIDQLEKIIQDIKIKISVLNDEIHKNTIIEKEKKLKEIKAMYTHELKLMKNNLSSLKKKK